MALPNPAAGDSVAAAHIDSIRTHLEGGSGDTAPYKLRQSTGDFIVVLADNAGSSEFSIHDSDDIEVAHIDSNGSLTVTSTVFTNLDIPTSATPSQTTEGRMVWDSDDDVLTVGDGSSRKTFYSGAPTWEHIDTQILSGTAASVSFASISSSYTAFRLTMDVVATAALALYLRLNNDSGSNYDYVTVIDGAAGSNVAAAAQVVITNAFATFLRGFGIIHIGKPVAGQQALINSFVNAGSAANTTIQYLDSANWRNTADLIN